MQAPETHGEPSPLSSEPASATARKVRHYGWLLALFIACAAAILVYNDTLGMALLGVDTYPTILGARIQNIGDLLSTFNEELMDGLYPRGHFYRPLVNLTTALDYAIWGLRPWGYHLTDLLILGACTFALGQLLRVFGRAPIWASALAAFFFLVHPVHLNVLPVVARRADSMVLLFTLLALLAAARDRSTNRLAPTAYTLLALGSKETGVLVPVLIFLICLLTPSADGKPPWRRAFMKAALPFAALVLFLALRRAVLGDVGGHSELTLAGVQEHAFWILPEFLRLTFDPHAVMSARLSETATWALALFVLGTSSLFLLQQAQARGPVLLAWAWFILGWAIHGLSQTVRPDIPWYTLHTVAPLALLFGVHLQQAFSADLQPRERLVPISSGLFLCGLLLINLKNVPLFTARPEWHEGTRQMEAFLKRVERKVTASPDGTVVDANRAPGVLESPPGSPIPRVPCLGRHSIQAWTVLRFPDRSIRVVDTSIMTGRQPPPEPNELVLVIQTRD